MGSVRFRVQTMGRRPLPSVARVRPSTHSARHQDSRNDLTTCRMAWYFVSASAHVLDSDQTLAPTPTWGASHSARRLCSLPSLCSSRDLWMSIKTSTRFLLIQRSYLRYWKFNFSLSSANFPNLLGGDQGQHQVEKEELNGHRRSPPAAFSASVWGAWSGRPCR